MSFTPSLLKPLWTIPVVGVKKSFHSVDDLKYCKLGAAVGTIGSPDSGWNLDCQNLDILLDLDSEGLITEKLEYDSKSRSFNKYNLQSYLVLLCEEESRWCI